MALFQSHLNVLKQKNRFRSLNLPAGIDLTSNDYLGLAEHGAMRDAAISYMQEGGAIGAGGSRLLRGHTDAHAALEEMAAEFFAAPKALFFSSGFQTNSALFQTLPSRHDTIIFDEYVHASAREGIYHSKATRVKVAHNDVAAFEAALKGAEGQAWLAVESVYSMDGDAAPLSELYDLAEKYDAMLVVDEAHGTGVCGEKGRGVSESLIAKHGYDRLIVLHTCGKAMGVAGGLLCASEDVIDMMINAARGFVYSTAPMPLQAHLVQKSLEIIGSEEGAARRVKLENICEKAKALFGGEGSHIVPIVIGDDGACVALAEMLQQKGWDIRAIRPPSVPEGTARLRLSLSAELDETILENFAADLEAAQQRRAA